MKKILSIVVKVLFIAAAGYGVFLVHQAENSWWLDIFLTILAIQLAVNLFAFLDNAYLWKKFIASLSTISISFLSASVVYLYIKPNWLIAALAGLIAAFIINMVFVWNEVMAQIALTQAQNLLKSNPKEAIRNALRARELYLKRRLKPGQADAEAFLAQAYSSTQAIQAIRYANSALLIYRELNNRQQVIKMEKMLRGFKLRNFDTKSTASEIQPEFSLDYQVFLQGFLWIFSWVGILLIWKFEGFQGSLLNLILMGVSLLVFVYGFFIIRSFSEFGKKKNGFSYILLTLAWIFLNAAGLIFGMGRPDFKLKDFPAVLHDPLNLFSEFSAGFPEWLVYALLGSGVVLGLIALLRLRSAGSQKEFLSNLFGGNLTEKKLIAARENLLAGEWSQAIMTLNQIDMTQKRHQSVRSEVLFNLSFAHFNATHLIEAKQFLKELLSIENSHKYALYLLGYIHLSENKLDEAENTWRKLVSIDRNFTPKGNLKSRLSACHYLCVTLYRKAVALVGKDDEAVSKLIAEVSQLEALNQEMADVLVRINLNTFCQSVRQNDWTKAGTVLEGVQKQLGHLKGLIQNEKDLKKLHGLTLASEGLLAFSQHNYAAAVQKFDSAEKETRTITQTRNPKLLDGKSPFEVFLKSVLEAKRDPDKVHSEFPRDLLFMLSISRLRQLHDSLSSLKKQQVLTEIKKIEKILEQISLKNTESIEARGLLGLIYYFFGDDEKQTFGMEMLQMVREGIGSRFINQVVEKYEAEKKQSSELKKNYYSLLEQFLHSSTVSVEEREQLRKQVLKQMRKDGQYDEFIGEGKFDMDSDRDREPTVKEYIDRMALLHEKMEQIRKIQTSDAFSSEVQSLMDELNQYNRNLKDQVQSITTVEQKLLLAAQKFL